MAGDYSSIWIEGPYSASKGSVVELEVCIFNSYHGAINLTTTGKVNGTVLSLGSPKIVAAGRIESWYTSFVMPDKDMLVSVWSWYKGASGAWYVDDSITREIELIAGPVVPDSEFRNLAVVVG